MYQLCFGLSLVARSSHSQDRWVTTQPVGFDRLFLHDGSHSQFKATAKLGEFLEAGFHSPSSLRRVAARRTRSCCGIGARTSMSAPRIPLPPSRLPVSGAETCCPKSGLARAVIAVLFHGVASFARGCALTLGALVQHVLIGQLLACTVSRESVGMSVLPPVDPGPPPGCVIDDHHVRVPIKAAIPPAPWAKEIANGHEEAKADRAADVDPGLRRKEYNRRVALNSSLSHGTAYASGAREIFDCWQGIVQLVGGLPTQVREVRISETMRPDFGTGGECLGLWEPDKKRIIIKRTELTSITSFAGTLLHEITHARSSAPDVSRDFETALTAVIGQLSSVCLR